MPLQHFTADLQPSALSAQAVWTYSVILICISRFIIISSLTPQLPTLLFFTIPPNYFRILWKNANHNTFGGVLKVLSEPRETTVIISKIHLDIHSNTKEKNISCLQKPHSQSDAYLPALLLPAGQLMLNLAAVW